METYILTRLIVTAGIILFFVILSQFLKRYAKATQKKYHLADSRYYALKRVIYAINITIAIALMIIIWGVDIMDIWVSITGIIAMVAIGLVATWSLLANALAGVILFFVSPFKTDDHIEILPEAIAGQVLTINLFYTILIDQDGNHINIPNTLFYLRFIKVIKTKTRFSSRTVAQSANTATILNPQGGGSSQSSKDITEHNTSHDFTPGI